MCNNKGFNRGIKLLVAKEYEKQLDKVSKTADRAKDSIEKLNAAMKLMKCVYKYAEGKGGLFPLLLLLF